MKHIFRNLSGKRLVWKKYVRIYTDAGQPKFRWYPVFMRHYINPCWGMHGLIIYWLGREFNFVFGEDKKGLFIEEGK